MIVKPTRMIAFVVFDIVTVMMRKQYDKSRILYTLQGEEISGVQIHAAARTRLHSINQSIKGLSQGAT